MTATQAPTPGPLDSESVKLLVKGDLLRVVRKCEDGPEAGSPVTFERADGNRIWINDDPDSWWFDRFAFIGRPGADGWMPWSGGENPVPGQRVECKTHNGRTWGQSSSESLRWSHLKPPSGSDIIAFRLAPTAPVEASGSEREAVARIVREEYERLVIAGDDKRDNADRASDRILALLSARPIALGGQQGEEAPELAFEYARDFGVGFIVDGKAVRPDRVTVCHGDNSWLRQDTAPARAEAQDEGAAGELAVAWHETFIVEEEGGAAVGIVIDLPDGSQIWTGECSTQLLEDARAREEDPEASGQYLIVAAKGEPTRVIAQIATVDDGIALARAIAGHAPAHPSPTPAADAGRVRKMVEGVLEETLDYAKDNAPLSLVPKIKKALAALKSTAAKEGGEV